MSEIKGIDGIFKFFGEAGVFWLATEDGAQPKVVLFLSKCCWMVKFISA